MMRVLTILFSAIVAAGLFIVAREHAHPAMAGELSAAGASLFTAPVPVIAAALSFPALYLLWEQSEL